MTHDNHTPTNQDRATRAARTLDAYAAVRDDASSAAPFGACNPAPSDVVDLLADVLHLLGPARFATALGTAMRHHAAETNTARYLPVFVPAADADILPDALAAAAERESSDVDDWSADGEHDEQAKHHRECVSAFDRLADAIAASMRQEGTAL